MYMSGERETNNKPTKVREMMINKGAMFTTGGETYIGVITEVLDGGRLYGIKFYNREFKNMSTIDLPRSEFVLVD